MRIVQYIIILGIIISVNACTSGKVLTEQNNSALSAYNSGEYKKSFDEWEKTISYSEKRNKKADPSVYSGAGKSALAINDLDKARKYLELAVYSNQTDAITYDSLASLYFNIDNLSKEINTLESIINKFPEYKNSSDIKERLLGTYIRSENWEKAYKFWPEVKDISTDNPLLLAYYFKSLVGLHYEDKIKSTGKQILTIDKDNITILEYYALSYYTKGKSRYKREMEAYETNKTTRQYNILLKELKLASGDFRKSRDYYERLYSIAPNSEYAKYLGNIYSNLKNKEKAAYYRSLE